MLNLVPRQERGAALETAADAADAGFMTSKGLTADRAAHMPFGLGAALPSVSAVVRSRSVSGPLSAFQPAPRAAFGAGQWYAEAQPQAVGPCGAPPQPQSSKPQSSKPQTSNLQISNNYIKQYPHTTRIAAGNSGAKGPHPARDPV